MAHEITITNGFAEFASSLTPAWHGLGTTLDHAMNSREAMKEARLDWSVEQEKMGRFRTGENFDEYMEDPIGYVERFGNPWDVCVDNHGEPNVLANVRGDNGLYLGNVTDHYKVVQNSEAFSFVDSLVEDGSIRYESAFSLSGGKKVVLLAQMPGAFSVVDGDEQVPYILMSLSHDGTGAIKFGPTSVRVVCANTYGFALSGRNGKSIRELSIGHKGNVQDKLLQAKDILMASRAGFSDYNEKCVGLAQKRMSQGEWLNFLNILCPEMDKNDPDWTELRAKRLGETRSAITDAYHNERQQTAPQTAWAAWNAVTEHIDHLPRRGATQARKAEARFNTCFYGVGRDAKERAWQTACKFAGCA